MSTGGDCRPRALSPLIALCIAGALAPTTTAAAPPFRGTAEPIGPHLRQHMAGRLFSATGG
jgi:hypothetical protein